MNVAVIGAGPAGVLAAGFAAGGRNRILLIDKNEKICKKLFITGKGRCNITNNCAPDEFISNVVTNPRFLFSAVKAFPPSAAISLLEELGCPLKTERGNRVFPSSDKSSDVISAFKKFLSNNNVEIKLNTECKGIEKNGVGFVVNTNKSDFKVDRVIICGGGASYPATGSTGQIFDLIKKSGHKVIDLKPALCPLALYEDVAALAGLSLKNVSLEVLYGGKKIFADFGEMLFTHEGVSGPMILSASSYLNKYADKSGTLENAIINIDLKPALDEKTLIGRINRDLDAAKNKLFKNSLNDLLPKSLIPYIIKLSLIPEDLQANSVTSQQRRHLALLLKKMTFNVKALGSFENAIVTSGGVDVKEINPSTMESKIIKGLYFAGEVIDVDALTGGFNLQIAMSTGYAAGVNAGKQDD
jgi:predicted Rossmann fold flavoprotein